jgi:hypothetical protein
MISYEKHGVQLSRGLLVAVVALTASCSTGASAFNTPQFAGKWSYAKKCDSGHFLSLDLKQGGDRVTGDWSEGTDLRGSGGKLEGQIRGNKLYARYCSDDGEVGYEACPKFSGDEDYFVIDKGTLVRYQKFGTGYRRDLALHPDIAGKEVPIDKVCTDMEER